MEAVLLIGAGFLCVLLGVVIGFAMISRWERWLEDEKEESDQERRTYNLEVIAGVRKGTVRPAPPKPQVSTKGK